VWEGYITPLPGKKRWILGLLEALRDKKIAGPRPGGSDYC